MALSGPSYRAAVMRSVPWRIGMLSVSGRTPFLIRRCKTTYSGPKYTDDELAIPKERSWSVHELLERNALDTKELTDKELDKLYRLAALQAPCSEAERANVKKELREIIRLVDAVKHVDTSSVSKEEAMHSTIWPEDQSLRLHDPEEMKGRKPNEGMRTDDGSGALPRDDLLKLAKRTLGKMYVVDRE